MRGQSVRCWRASPRWWRAIAQRYGCAALRLDNSLSLLLLRTICLYVSFDHEFVLQTSEVITEILKDLHDMKKPDSTNFKRRNEKRPFEDETSVEFLCQKNEASVFGFGSHSKKRPNNLILGRLFNYKMYDMYELALTDIKTMKQFKPSKSPSLDNKPLIVFQGDAFDNDPKLGEIKNLFLDIFGHTAMTKVNLAGIEHAIVLTAQAAQGDKEGKIAFRHYGIAFKKSGSRVPRVELEEVGPHFDMEVRRSRPASAELQKEACRVPRQTQKSGKMKKNFEKNALGDTLGRVHMQKQDLDDFQVRKMKGLKRGRDKMVEAAAEDDASRPAKVPGKSPYD
jgi:ribosome production factor 2